MSSSCPSCARPTSSARSNAERAGKTALLRKLAVGDLRYGPIDHSVDQVIVIGDSAVIAGTMHANAVVDGRPRRVAASTLSVWSRTGGSWRFIAFQPTPLPLGTAP
jgi:hypothetical protein